MTFQQVPVWNSVTERLEEDAAACRLELDELDIAKILGGTCVLVRYCVDRYTLGSWQLAALACASGQTCTPD